MAETRNIAKKMIETAIRTQEKLAPSCAGRKNIGS